MRQAVVKISASTLGDLLGLPVEVSIEDIIKEDKGTRGFWHAPMVPEEPTFLVKLEGDSLPFEVVPGSILPLCKIMIELDENYHHVATITP